MGYIRSAVDDLWNDSVADGLPDELDRLVYLAGLLGRDPDLARHGGGNVSLKRPGKDVAGRELDVLWVKAANTPMHDIGRAGFTALRLADFSTLATNLPQSDETLASFLSAVRLDPQDPIPTVEAPLHAALPFPVVLHTHDFPTLALTDTTRRDALVREVWGAEVAYAGYVRPGFPLVKTVMGLSGMDRVQGLVLGKHGFVTWGNTCREAYRSLLRLLGKAEAHLRRARAAKNPLAKQRHSPGDPARRLAASGELLPALRGMLSRYHPAILHLDDAEEARCFADSELAKQIHRRGMATPEHILRCGRMPCYVDATLASLPREEAVHILRQAVDQFEADIRLSFRKHGRGDDPHFPMPRVVILPGIGLVTAGRDKAGAVAASQAYRQVVRVIEFAEAVDQFRFLEEASSFEYEAYYPMLARPEGAVPELQCRVAVVTGAARGMGRAVAVRFAEEGAHLVLTDLDAEGLEQAREEAAEAAGHADRVRAVPADITDERQSAKVFEVAVSAFGGVDILVCNAGIVQAAPVEAYPEPQWDRHFDVNVKGSWLPTREAVRIMKAQGGGVLLYNVSKAAFAPALDNSAYAASKAALAGMARSLALELGGHGIRVNYVNADFVDTPMMRRMAESRAAIKGIPLEQQYEEYRRRNLLEVGPIPPRAVAEALLFLAGDRARYTTGGVLTVDGGLRDAMPR
jgi:rhamnose utilization protein RhaD (predicted bifunctional aldolase and dehydrogenase)/NAD(P)-dependent dehydrogenase (short-subunit alcohol dehydrogenase family)